MQNPQPHAVVDLHGGGEGIIEIPIQLAVDADSAKQSAAVDFDAVLVRGNAPSPEFDSC